MSDSDDWENALDDALDDKKEEEKKKEEKKKGGEDKPTPKQPKITPEQVKSMMEQLTIAPTDSSHVFEAKTGALEILKKTL